MRQAERADADAIIAAMKAKNFSTESAPFEYPADYKLPKMKKQRTGDSALAYPDTDSQYAGPQPRPQQSIAAQAQAQQAAAAAQQWTPEQVQAYYQQYYAWQQQQQAAGGAGAGAGAGAGGALVAGYTSDDDDAGKQQAKK